MKNVAVRIGLIALSTAVVVTSGVALAQSPPVPATNSAPAFSVLVGRWTRTQGPYVISINAVDDSGRLDASYANPKPLPFYRAEATRDGNALKLYFELRAAGYGGSTYTLNYDAASDSLRGVYDQVCRKAEVRRGLQPYEVTGWLSARRFIMLRNGFRLARKRLRLIEAA